MGSRHIDGLRRNLFLASGLATLLGGLASTAPAHADCSVPGLSGTVKEATIAAASTVAAAGATPAYCKVEGKLATSGEGADPGSAGFELRLPTNWNGKVLFWGVGGLAGATYADFAANPVDLQAALPKGYATVITDEGHKGGGTDASFALLAKGKPNWAARADYEFRATHQVTVAAKRLAAAYYSRPVTRAYFDGCSNGGRQAMVEATRYPEDFDGIIAGAPFLDLQVITAAAAKYKALFAKPESYLPASALPAIDAKVRAACDAADGVSDGLIQNPAACNVRTTDLGLSAPQATELTTYISALRDQGKRVIYPGFSITDFANGGMDRWSIGEVPPSAPNSPDPWGNKGFKPAPTGFQFTDHILQYYYALDPDYDYRAFPVTPEGTATDAAIRAFDSRTSRADAGRPGLYDRFIAQGRKMIWYHGLSDPALPPFRSFVLYEALAARHGGYDKLQGGLRFFAVPDMQHCGSGPGPNFFDTLGPLEAWVEQGKAPDALMAAHYPNDKPAPGVAPDRTMPLCPFPTQASYAGGDVKAAASWSCKANTRMLDVGLDGRLAGLPAHK
ncbi:Tannase and feruloyl esterase [Beijerinckiaceae bacterium RH AL1]|nr:Tannase and feruloyl esterase [Beijerinckiaceae bacterium RH AL8]VVB43705.1 Tannase and feruloyl esterase [Beijerinckiaceae bacterium RH CH11]VVC53962.1 Tannase and feruloyl esterase [Beijerinckiaceae bacterium RH AL1]